jgi:hypothetical protein
MSDPYSLRAGLTQQESRITNLQSNRISRTGTSGFVSRSSIAATAATPISHVHIDQGESTCSTEQLFAD